MHHNHFISLILSVCILLTIGYATAQQSHPWDEVEIPAGVWSDLDSDTLDGYDSSDFLALGYWSNIGSDIYNLNSGNVGIGTSTPASKLSVVQPTDSNAVISIDSGSSASQYSAIDLYDRGTNEWGIGKDPSNSFYIAETGQGVRMIILPGGNVGIGTPAPGYVLEVSGAISGTHLCIGSDCRSSWPTFTDTDTRCDVPGTCSQVCIGTSCQSGWPSSPWTLSGGNVYRSSGRVGIGTPTPGYELDVSGTLRATSFIGDGTQLTGVLHTESDPAFSSSPSAAITSGQVTNWDAAFSWGDHSTQGYLTSYTETDPEVSSTTSDQWCRGTGSAVTCDQPNPTTTCDWTGTRTLDGVQEQQSCTNCCYGSFCTGGCIQERQSSITVTCTGAIVTDMDLQLGTWGSCTCPGGCSTW